jgi:SAM-dependent methyltransferase
MKPCAARDGDPLTKLGHWYRTPVGRYIAHAEAVCLERLLADGFGHYLVQFGAQAQFVDAIRDCRIRQRVVIGEGLEPSGGNTVGVRALPYELPLESASVDAMLLPHTLDFCEEAHQVLREVERVLIPEGRVILFCFNPLSPWGLTRWWPRRASRRRVPWCGGQLTPFRVGDWLRLLGFQQESRDMLAFRPPLRRALAPGADWLEGAGSRYWPIFGGVFAVKAVKRVPARIHRLPAWRQPPPLLPARPAEPTARNNGHE